MAIPVWIWIGLTATSILLVQEIVRPRLPIYTLTASPWMVPSSITDPLSLWVNNHVSFFNDNYLDIEVHALTFDLYYMDWEGSLAHMGRIRDPRQTSPQTDNKKESKPPVLWKLTPRRHFETDERLLLSLNPSFLLHFAWRYASRLLHSLWHGRGTLLVPTSGVAQLTANKLPFMLSIVCDNVVNTWSMQVSGIDCALFQLDPAWRTDINTTAWRVQDYALQHLKANAVGGILAHPTKKESWERVVRALAWEEALQSV